MVPRLAVVAACAEYTIYAGALRIPVVSGLAVVAACAEYTIYARALRALWCPDKLWWLLVLNTQYMQGH